MEAVKRETNREHLFEKALLEIEYPLDDLKLRRLAKRLASQLNEDEGWLLWRLKQSAWAKGVLTGKVPAGEPHPNLAQGV